MGVKNDHLRAALLLLKDSGLFCDVTLIAADDNTR